MTDDSTHSSRFIDYLLFRALKGDVTPAEAEKVAEWRAASPSNEAYYRELEALLALTSESQAPLPATVVRPPVARELLGRSAGALGLRGGTRPGRSRLLWGAGGVAALAAGLVLVFGLSAGRGEADLLSLGVDEFATGSSDVATVQLRDGTIVRLAPRSRLRLTGAPDAREVTLEGRAYFAVATMDGYPFTVKTRGGDAVVLGTRFEAEAHGEELRVLVVEGRVALAASGRRVQVDAGETARAVQGAVSSAVTVPDPHRSIEWVGDFLVFQGTPIEEVAEELRRFYGMKLVVLGERLDHQTVTAWFPDPVRQDVIRVVCTVLAASCSEKDGTTIIDLRSTRPQESAPQ